MKHQNIFTFFSLITKFKPKYRKSIFPIDRAILIYKHTKILKSFSLRLVSG